MGGTRRRRGRPARAARRERAMESAQVEAQEQARPARVRRGPISTLKRNIDSFGGLLVIGAVVGAVVIVVVLLLRGQQGGGTDLPASDAPLLGIAVTITSAAHIPEDQASRMQITPGIPPAGGPHFQQWLAPGIYDTPVPDGNAIHSLEHGVVWITYNPELLDEAGVEELRSIAGDYSNDVIVSPRPENDSAVGISSWGRYLVFDEVDEQALRDFVVTNVNRSPEPGIRGGGTMTRDE